MYYEEKIIDGELYWRDDPKGVWRSVSKKLLTGRIVTLEIMLEKQKPMYKISAVYYPHLLELEQTFQDIETGEKVSFTSKVTKEQGEAVSNLIPPCSYHTANV